MLQEIWWQDPLLGSNALRRSIMLLDAEGMVCRDFDVQLDHRNASFLGPS